MGFRMPTPDDLQPRPLPGTNLRYFSVRGAVGDAAFSRLNYSQRVFAENLLRRAKMPEQARESLRIVLARGGEKEFPFHPARVVLQDLTGTPALVDLAGLRNAVAATGGDPTTVNPLVRTQLVVDHSMNVMVSGTRADAMTANMAQEQAINAERFEFLAWCKRAFSNLDVLMPGNGILHQINLERLSPVIQQEDGVAFPDTLVGTDSHTTMINGLGVLGWGVGGIEAESVMLGRAIWMRLPEIVEVRLTGRPNRGVVATDIVLALTEFLRKAKVVASIVEFTGDGCSALSLGDRATITNMGPEFGVTAAMFSIDGQTLDYMRTTGRSEELIRLTEIYAREQGLWGELGGKVEYDRTLVFDLSSVGRSMAGPYSPHQLVPVDKLIERGVAKPETPPFEQGSGSDVTIEDGHVVLAAITSCTNTANARAMMAAGLLARAAVARGLARRPWVKTSLAPGSRVVERYLEDAGLLEPLAQLGFGIVGFACTSCNGMSGPLSPDIVAQIKENNLVTAAVLSGNRNFKGRVHPYVKEAFLAAPALVVAYAIAGTTRLDVEHDVIAHDADGIPVRLADLWPSEEAIDAALARHVHADQFLSVYGSMFPDGLDDDGEQVPVLFPWREDSTYICLPPYWDAALLRPATFQGMRPLALLGDNITTDDLSPSGAILPESAAGEYLLSKGVKVEDFNSYGTRRGHHAVAVRATLANNQLRNEMAGGRDGALARLEPDGEVMRLYDAAETYLGRGQELVIIAGNNYGSGSSRDWAAKGVRLLGVRAVICESFERIHRSNLVGMGVLPLEFESGVTRHTLGLDGTERFTLLDWHDLPEPGAVLRLEILRADGRAQIIGVICRIQTQEEARVFAAGGLLPQMKNDMVRCNAAEAVT